MEIDWEKENAEALERLQQKYPNAVSSKAERWELEYSGRTQTLQDYLRVGEEINVFLSLSEEIPKLLISHLCDDATSYFDLWATKSPLLNEWGFFFAVQ